MKVAFLLTIFLVNALAQTVPKNAFPIRIIKVKREAEICRAEVESPTVAFHIRSDMSSVCGMLRAGESYKALRATIENDPADETKDSTTLIIYNNVENSRRPNAVFTIDSEEAIPNKK